LQAVEQSARQCLYELQAQAQEQSPQLQAAQQVVDAIKARRDVLLKQAEVGGWLGWVLSGPWRVLARRGCMRMELEAAWCG
jgi:hypothetical protein